MAKNLRYDTNNIPSKIFYNNQPVKFVYWGEEQVWRARPDFLFQNATVDGELLTSWNGRVVWNDGSSKLAHYYKDGAMVIETSASSGYGNEYGGGYEVTTNWMDLSGIDTLIFNVAHDVDVSIGGWGKSTATVRIVDNAGKTYSLWSDYIDTADKWRVGPLNLVADLKNSGLNLASCYFRFQNDFKHYAPWGNWYGGGAGFQLYSIQTQ